MSFFQRPTTLAEVAEHVLEGADAGMEIKDFLHEFKDAGRPAMLGAYLQALAVYLAVKVDSDPPKWTQPAIQLPDPWFASPGAAIRNYLLISSPAPFRSRNLFIDEDSLIVI